MRLFIFDTNVKKEGGHFYPWDMQILIAAKERGFEPFLVVSEDFSMENQECEVIKAYSVPKIDKMFYLYTKCVEIFPLIEKMKCAIKLVMKIIYKKYDQHIKQAKNIGERPIYMQETFKVFKQYKITEDDHVIFAYIGLGHFREIEKIYRKLPQEYIPHTSFAFAEAVPPILETTDRDFHFSNLDFEFTEIFNNFHSMMIDNRMKVLSMEDNSKNYFETILGTSSIIMNAPRMSFGNISIQRKNDARINFERHDVMQIGTLGGYTEIRGADRMGDILVYVVKKVVENNYSIRFNIKTETNTPKTLAEKESYKKIKKISNKYVFCTDNDNTFSIDEYFELFKQQDVIFLPYSNLFKYANSGVLSEAYVLGRPTIVTSGTGLARTIKTEQFDYLSQVETKKGFDEKSVTTQMIVEGKEEQTLIVADNLLNKHYGLLKISSSVPGGRLRKETSVSIFIYEQDKKGMCLRRRERLIESNDNREFKALIKLMNDTEKLVVKVSNADSIYAIELSDIQILFSEEEDIRLGVIGLDFTTEDDLFDVIEEIYLNYDHYAETARVYGEKWSKKYSAEKMLDDWVG